MLMLPLTAVLTHNIDACARCSFRKDRLCSAGAAGVESRVSVLAVRGACPKGLHEPPPTPVLEHLPRADARPHASRREPFWKLWADLHTRPRDGWAGGDDLIWLYLFVTRIPCGECRREYLDWLRTKPIDFTRGAAHYFEATVVFHNRVNEKRQKPLMWMEEARRTWGY